MALIDKASLLMVPSTYEAGKLYNVLPSGNRAPDNKGGAGYDQTRADFDFDRGSNTAATRIGSDGLIKKYRENLLTESNNFSDSDWSPKAGTFAQGIEDPNGGNEAWSWTATNTDPYLYQAIGTSGVFTLSIYAKGVGSTIGKVLELRNGSTTQNFTLTSEWQRFELYAAAGGSNIGFEFGNPAVIGDVMYIYAAQWETGLVATDYLDSGATTAKAGVLVDLPRINFDANGENGALLLEPSRANLVPYSEYFEGWSVNSNITRTSNYIVSPEGTQNATRLQFTANGFCSNKTQSLASYTMSCYAKRNDSGTQNVGFFTNGSNTVNSAWAVTSEWKRFSYTFPALNAGAMGIAGVSGADISVYGFQIEGLATYPSSYIPNHGATGGITRAADSCSVTGVSDVIGQTEGTIYAEYNFDETIDNQGGSDRDILSMTDGTFNNSIQIVHYGNGVGSAYKKVYLYVRVSSSYVVTISSPQYNSGLMKVACGYKNNDYVLYVNGVQIGTDTSAGVPACSEITIGKNATLTTTEINQTTLFNERLSNAELATLTTL